MVNLFDNLNTQELIMEDLVTLSNDNMDIEIANRIRINIISIDKSNLIDVNISTHKQEKYLGDFYGLLQTLDVPQYLYLSTMEINGLKSSTDFSGMGTIKLINEDYIEELLK